MVIRRGETAKEDKHYVQKFTDVTALNKLFFDPVTNTQIHIHNQTITNLQIDYPYLLVSGFNTTTR